MRSLRRIIMCLSIALVLLCAPNSQQFHQSIQDADIYLPQEPVQTSKKTRPAPPRVVRPTNAVLCLAQNLYFEARNEPLNAMEAVAATVFNRMSLPDYPSTVCGVVYQYRQYSWTLVYSRWTTKPPKKFVELSREFLNNRHEIQSTHPVTHFHRYDILPKWAPTMIEVSQIGAHIFYRM